MNALLNQIASQGNLIFLIFVFLSAVLFVMAVVSMTTSWFGVRKRAVAEAGTLSISNYGGSSASLFGEASGKSSLDFLMPKDEKEKSEIRRFLNLAGYYGRLAPMNYQLIRFVLAIAFGLASPFIYMNMYPSHPFSFALIAGVVMALLGFMLPRTIVSMKRDGLMEEHRQGFPDFLDLLVICVEAGVGIDSAIDRVSRDMATNYPSLARNLGFMTLEMRAGRSTRDALDNLADRLGIEEARSFATLIQQSEELGSSLVQSLRVYADEMRAKRLARAEEKAHALPVKLVIPLGLFCFPVVLGVTLFPVALKLFKALGSG
jgi:tight adherence protein C